MRDRAPAWTDGLPRRGPASTGQHGTRRAAPRQPATRCPIRRYSDCQTAGRTPFENIAEGPDEGAIAAAIIKLCDSLGLEVIAEGIDKPEQVKERRRLRCTFGQGYFFAKPVPPEELTEIVRNSLPYDPVLNPSDSPRA